MKKKSVIIEILLVIVLTALITAGLSSVVRRKESLGKYKDFMKNGELVDVVFLGSSHMLNALNPLQLYRDYGISSYNLAKHGGMVPESYWTLKLAEKYCKPKCVVIDVWSLDRDYKYVDVMTGSEDDNVKNSISLLHSNMDAWPLSGTKIKAVKDLVKSDKVRTEFLFDYSLYHSRWNALNENDFTVSDSEYLFGSLPRNEFYPLDSLDAPDDNTQRLEGETVSTEYLRKIIQECQEQNIDVVLTFMPMQYIHDQDYQAVNTAAEIADEYGIKLVSLLDHDNEVVNLKTDMCDDSHVNLSGMTKITSYLGKILSEEYELTDHRNDLAYSFYDEEVNTWQMERLDEFIKQSNPYLFLNDAKMLGAKMAIYIKKDSPYLYDELYENYLDSIAGPGVAESAKEIGGPLLISYGLGTDEPNHIIIGQTGGDQFETENGICEYVGLPEFAALYFNGDYDNNYLDMEKNYSADVQIIVFGADGEVISRRFFSLSKK